MDVIFIVFLVLLNQMFTTTHADILNEDIYINIKSTIPCIRRLNSTHQIGCGDADKSNYNGIIFHVDNANDLAKLQGVQPYKKLILATRPQYFQAAVDFHLNADKNKIINGIVLMNSNSESTSDTQKTPDASYSDDRQIPNFKFDYNADQSPIWNVNGSSNQFIHFKVPIYLVYNETEINTIIQFYNKFNSNYFAKLLNNTNNDATNDLLLGMEMGLEMFGSGNSHVCLRRNLIQHSLEDNSGFCDPLGGSNIYGFLNPDINSNDRFIMLTSRIDTFTLFEYHTPAGNEPVTSIISLLAIIDLLTAYRVDFKSNVLFYFFDNEAFDYGGSQRFLFDLTNKKFPGVYLNNTEVKMGEEAIDLILELGQLGSIGITNDTTTKLYIHKDQSANKTILANLIDAIQSISNGQIESTNLNQPIPPSSLHTMLRFNSSISGILITDHKDQYKNKYYHSIYDEYKLKYPLNYTEQLDNCNYTTDLSKSLQQYTTYIAQAVYKQIVNRSLAAVVDQQLVNRLVYCFYADSLCSLFRSVLNKHQLKDFNALLKLSNPPMKLTFYTGVNNSTQSGRYIINSLFTFLARLKVYDSLNETECAKFAPFSQFIDLGFKDDNLIFNGTKCVVSYVYQNSSRSPAFFQNADAEVTIKTDGSDRIYSTWTESQWESKQIQMKLFLYNNKFYDYFTIVVGVLFTLLSGISVCIFSKYKPFAQSNSIEAF